MDDAKPATVPATVHYSAENRPRQSPTIGKLAAALAKAQGEMENVSKDATNPAFKSKYATLSSTWDAIREPLAKNEIAIYQRPLTIGGVLKMCTMLLHSSGEFMDDSELEMIFNRQAQIPMQAMGSSVTYARRYTLQAATGVAPADDDDGQNAGKPAVEPSGPLPQKKQDPKPAAKEPAKKTNPNMAPADQLLMDQITDLAIERRIPESILMHLVRQGYGCTTNVPPRWIALEIADLLSNEDCTEVTVMAQSQRVLSRREAARITKEGGLNHDPI